MKKIYTTLFVVCVMCAYVTGQTINVSQKMIAVYSGYSTPDTISATGLIPTSGQIVVAAPIKFYLVGSSSISADTIIYPYTGGSLPPTVVEIGVGFSGMTWGNVTISGGGAYAEICARGNNIAYQCNHLSVSDISDEPSIAVSPNPAANSLTVSATKNITSVTIRDLVGRTVHAQQCDTKELNADITALPAGVYLLWINDTDVRKFIKN